jgi:hypothetical protein
LRQLGDALPSDWRRVVMVKNDGPIPVPDHPVEGDPGRGFNLLLLSAEGAPAYYVRCRDADDAIARRETELLRVLGECEEVRAHLPETAGGRADGIQVMAARYIDGPLLSRLAQQFTAEQWEAAMIELVEVAFAIGHAGIGRVPGWAGATPFDFVAESEEALGRLVAGGLGAERAEALRAALRVGGTAARFPQHGDLWPGNVVRNGAVWRLLDFEQFGLVDAPLFDACHLAFTATEYHLNGGHGMERPWATLIREGTPIGRSSRTVLAHAARRYGLSRESAGAALVHYLIEGTDRLIRRGALQTVWEVPFQELMAAGDLAVRGAPPGEVYFQESGA